MPNLLAMKQSHVGWFEIPVTDMDRAKAFYQTLLGLELHDLTLANGLQMALFPENEQGGGGALACYPDFYQPGTQGPLLYLQCPDGVGATLERAIDLKARIQVPQSQISEERGYMAVLLDSEGNRIALIGGE